MKGVSLGNNIFWRESQQSANLFVSLFKFSHEPADIDKFQRFSGLKDKQSMKLVASIFCIDYSTFKSGFQFGIKLTHRETNILVHSSLAILAVRPNANHAAIVHTK